MASKKTAWTPEVRQCLKPDDHQYGWSATQGAGMTAGKWLVGVPENGAHWVDDVDVEDWTVLVPKA